MNLVMYIELFAVTLISAEGLNTKQFARKYNVIKPFVIASKTSENKSEMNIRVGWDPKISLSCSCEIIRLVWLKARRKNRFKARTDGQNQNSKLHPFY